MIAIFDHEPDAANFDGLQIAAIKHFVEIGSAYT
jgi:hypothetical protein